MDDPVLVGVIYIVVSLVCSAMYIIYDVVYQLNYLLYHAPSVIIQLYSTYLAMGRLNNPIPELSLFEPSLGKQITFMLDSIQTYCWFNNSLSQISLALNRFIVTVLLRLNFFTRDRAIILSAAQHLMGIVIAVAAQLALPCCILQFDFTIFSYHEVYLPGVPNYSWTHLKLPVQIACSAVPLVLYTMILLTARSIGRQLKLQSRELNKRRKQELKFTVQFASIASLYTLSWVAFAVVPGEAFAIGWLRCLSAVLGILNATTNAIVFLLNDSKKLCSFCVASSPGGSTN